METRHKAAMVGSGLLAAGIGLSIVGTALLVPALVESAARLFEKSAEGTARRVGSVAGSLQRSFAEATRAGVTEFKRQRSGG